MDTQRLMEEALDRLYAGTPEEFMAVRKEMVSAARGAGARAAAEEIGRLRRPSMAAWVCNVIAREMTPVLEDLLEVGIGLREATRRGDVAALRALRADRDLAIDEMIRAAGEVLAEAGRVGSAAVLAQVRDTAIAALADERAAQVLASGSMVNPLSYSGFGEVDVTEAVARLADLPRPHLTVVEPPDTVALADRPTVPGVAEGDVIPACTPDAIEAARVAVDLQALRAALRAAHHEAARADEALEAAEAEVRDVERAILLARQHRAEARRQALAAKAELTEAQAALKAADPPPS